MLIMMPKNRPNNSKVLIKYLAAPVSRQLCWQYKLLIKCNCYKYYSSLTLRWYLVNSIK